MPTNKPDNDMEQEKKFIDAVEYANENHGEGDSVWKLIRDAYLAGCKATQLDKQKKHLMLFGNDLMTK